MEILEITSITGEISKISVLDMNDHKYIQIDVASKK